MKTRTKIVLLVSFLVIFFTLVLLISTSQGESSSIQNAILNGQRINVDGGYIEGHQLTREEWEELRDGWSGP